MQWLFGIHAVQAIVRQRPEAVVDIHLSGDNPRLQAIETAAKELGLVVRHTTQQGLEALFPERGKVVHQGVVCRVKPKPFGDEAALRKALEHVSEQSLFVVLDGVTDPQNVGAIFRSAEAAGVTGLICLNHNSAPINDTVYKIASGAVEFVPVYRVANLNRALQHVRKAGVWVLGMALPEDEEDSSTLLYDVDLKAPIALVLGAEGAGIRPGNLTQCDQRVMLPMLGVTQSLNVAQATSVALFEVVRQRR